MGEVSGMGTIALSGSAEMVEVASGITSGSAEVVASGITSGGIICAEVVLGKSESRLI